MSSLERFENCNHEIIFSYDDQSSRTKRKYHFRKHVETHITD